MLILLQTNLVEEPMVAATTTSKMNLWTMAVRL